MLTSEPTATPSCGLSRPTSPTVGQAKAYRVGRVLDKIGMKARDTCELFFDDVEAPVDGSPVSVPSMR